MQCKPVFRHGVSMRTKEFETAGQKLVAQGPSWAIYVCLTAWKGVAGVDHRAWCVTKICWFTLWLDTLYTYITSSNLYLAGPSAAQLPSAFVHENWMPRRHTTIIPFEPWWAQGNVVIVIKLIHHAYSRVRLFLDPDQLFIRWNLLLDIHPIKVRIMLFFTDL